MNGTVKLMVASNAMEAQSELSEHALNRTMSMASNIIPRNSNMLEDFDKLMIEEPPKTERYTEPPKIEKNYTFNVKMQEPEVS